MQQIIETSLISVIESKVVELEAAWLGLIQLYLRAYMHYIEVNNVAMFPEMNVK